MLSSKKLSMKEKMARVRAHKKGGISVGGVPVGGFMNDDEYVIEGGVAIGGRRKVHYKKGGVAVGGVAIGGIAIGGRKKGGVAVGGISVGGYKKGTTGQHTKKYYEKRAIVPYVERSSQEVMMQEPMMSKKARKPRMKKLKPVKIPSAKKSLTILKKMLYPTKTMREKHGHVMGLGLTPEHLNQLVILVEHWATTGGYDIGDLFGDVVKYGKYVV